MFLMYKTTVDSIIKVINREKKALEETKTSFEKQKDNLETAVSTIHKPIMTNSSGIKSLKKRSPSSKPILVFWL